VGLERVDLSALCGNQLVKGSEAVGDFLLLSDVVRKRKWKLPDKPLA
jgi:hypothetical protein